MLSEYDETSTKSLFWRAIDQYSKFIAIFLTTLFRFTSLYRSFRLTPSLIYRSFRLTPSLIKTRLHVMLTMFAATKKILNGGLFLILFALSFCNLTILNNTAWAADNIKSAISNNIIPDDLLDTKAFNNKVAGWMKILDGQEKALADSKLTDDNFNAIRTNLQSVRDEAQLEIEKTTVHNTVQMQLRGALGSPPSEGQPPENKEVTKQRATLDLLLSDLDGRIKRAGVVHTRADTLIRSSLSAARSRITTRLTQRDDPFFSLKLWQDGLKALATRADNVLLVMTNKDTLPNVVAIVKQSWLALITILVVTGVLFFLLRSFTPVKPHDNDLCHNERIMIAFYYTLKKTGALLFAFFAIVSWKINL